jgi:methylmalonyl-CoA decarboxylase subunit alpha
MGIREDIKELKRRKAKALEMGGADKTGLVHARGSYTARERIAKLLDPETFSEVGLLAHSDVAGMEEKTAADGKICGFGEIDGRTVAVRANDVSVLAGSGGRVGHKKSDFLSEMAVKNGYPIVNLGEAGGARIPDIQGSEGMSSMTITTKTSMRRRQVPLVATIMGECFGDPSWVAAAADFVVQVKGSCMAVSGPRVLTIATNEKITNEELGGWELHATETGQVDRAVESEEACFQVVREFLSYLPANADVLPPVVPCQEDPDPRQHKLLDIIPEKSNRIYDMKKLIKILVDHETLFELKPDFDPSVITCLARIDGRTVGIIANQPMTSAGAMGPDGCDKCTGFIVMCDSFHIPLLFLHDTPGFFVGPAAEKKRMPGKIINFIHALSFTTVPKISIVIRKSYGMANCNMCGAGMGADFFYAWPTADISFMGPEVAANVMMESKMAVSENPREIWEKAVAELRLASAPWKAAGLGFLDDVIDPVETRAIIIKSLKLASGKNGGMGERQMANWPTTY